jgi:hypothetical protein
MLRDPQHERKIINYFKSSPFVPRLFRISSLAFGFGRFGFRYSDFAVRFGGVLAREKTLG